MMLLSEFESTMEDKFSETSFSPLIETLSNSIMLTSNQNFSQKPTASFDTYSYGRKMLRPRDGHSANIFEEKKMIIFLCILLLDNKPVPEHLFYRLNIE